MNAYGAKKMFFFEYKNCEECSIVVIIVLLSSFYNKYKKYDLRLNSIQ